MTIYILKIIVAITLLSDYLGRLISFQANETLSLLEFILRSLGTIALPLIIFIIVEEFTGIKDKEKENKYIKNLLIFAIIAEIPYNLLISGAPIELKSQNLVFTLLLSVLCIRVLIMIEEKYSDKMLVINILNALATLAFAFLAAFLFTEYSYMGILLAVAFYLFKGSKGLQLMSIFIVIGYLSGDILNGIFAMLSMVFIWFYKGEKGKEAKQEFYIFYPVQLIVLYLIRLMIV